MNIILKSFSEKGLEAHDWRDVLQIEIDGKKEFLVHDGEPEDACLSRDFSDCWSVLDLMKRAYEAGKNRETLEIEKIKIDDWEELWK